MAFNPRTITKELDFANLAKHNDNYADIKTELDAHDAHIAAQTAHGSTAAATPGAIMQRDSEGRAKAAAPAAADDIARKAEVDAVQESLDDHIDDADVHLSEADRDKLDGIEAGAQPNQNAFAQVNNVVAASESDTLTIAGGTGIAISTNPTTKTVTVTATGEATPGPHGSSHNNDGSDPIPELVALRDEFDALTPESIGAETPAGAQAKVDALAGAGNTKTVAEVAEDVADVAAQLADIAYNVRKYGSIEAAINAAKANGGGTVYFPPGTYTINQTIQVLDIPNLTLKAFNNVILTTETEDLDYMFSFNNCPNLRIEGIEFDSNYTGKSIVRIEKSSNFVINKSKFIKFKEDAVDPLRHAIWLGNSPFGVIIDCKFREIGKTFGASGETPGTQYRSISVNSGCDRLRVEGNEFSDVFQCIVVGEFPYFSSSSVLYTVGSRVLHIVGGEVNQYRCIQENTSSVNLTPEDTSYWTLENAGIMPNEEILFLNNFCRNVRDNAIYFTEYAKQMVIDGNTFTYCHDEPIVVVGENALISNNVFKNIENKAIAIGDVVDIESIVVCGNTFENNNFYLGSFIAYRGSSPSSVTVKKLLVENNTFKSSASLGNASHFALPKIDVLIISNNIIETQANSNEVIIRTWGDVAKGIISDNVITAAAADALFYRDSAISNITIRGNKTNARAMANTANILIQDVRFDVSASNAYARESTSRWGFGTGIPAAGAWNRGDIIFNLAPNAGGNAGWICVVAGTPGTWKTFGTIAT